MNVEIDYFLSPKIPVNEQLPVTGGTTNWGTEYSLIPTPNPLESNITRIYVKNIGEYTLVFEQAGPNKTVQLYYNDKSLNGPQPVSSQIPLQSFHHDSIKNNTIATIPTGSTDPDKAYIYLYFENKNPLKPNDLPGEGEIVVKFTGVPFIPTDVVKVTPTPLKSSTIVPPKENIPTEVNTPQENPNPFLTQFACIGGGILLLMLILGTIRSGKIHFPKRG